MLYLLRVQYKPMKTINSIKQYNRVWNGHSLNIIRAIHIQKVSNREQIRAQMKFIGLIVIDIMIQMSGITDILMIMISMEITTVEPRDTVYMMIHIDLLIIMTSTQMIGRETESTPTCILDTRHNQ